MLFLKNKKFLNFLKFTGIILGLILVLGIGFRQQILNWGFEKAQDRLNGKGYLISADTYSFKGITSVSFVGFSVKQPTNLEIAGCDSLEVQLSLVKGLLGFGWIESIQFGRLRIQWEDSVSQIPNVEKSTELDEVKTTDLVNTSNKLEKIKQLLDQLPNQLHAKSIQIGYKHNQALTLIQIEKFHWQNEIVEAQISINQFNKIHTFSLEGNLNKQTLKGKLKVEGLNNEMVLVSMLGGRFGFSKMAFSIDDLHENAQGLVIQSNCDIDNAFIQHNRISDTAVSINKLIGKPIFQLGKGRVQMDSISNWRINTFNFQTGFHYPLKDTMGEFWAVLKFKKEAGSHLFPSLPVGLFRHTAGIRINGSFGHRFYVWYTPKDLSLTKLEADVQYSNDFKVINWGMVNPNYIKGNFHHDYYDGNRWEAGFEVGPTNPYYTPLDQIAPQLIQTTLRSEDPNFFYHKGFYIDAFREALNANIKEKRFARGGSTISMQLVKNVFLRQHKTLTRKLEEIILVWLLEHEKTVSKQRMLEVYFNIIEWGPGIFGVGSASQFYFGKKPSQLNLGESCYLTSLIPAPSKAIWSVDSSGNVNPRWSRYFKLKDRMTRLDSANIQDSDFEFNVRAFQ